MRLALIALTNVASVNQFAETFSLQTAQGQPSTLYLRLVDLDQPLTINLGGGYGFTYLGYVAPQATNPGNGYTRFVPAIGSTMVFNLTSLDPAAQVLKVGMQPFLPDDRSIWSMNILATDNISYNNITASLNMNGVIYQVPVISAIASTTSTTNQPMC